MSSPSTNPSSCDSANNYMPLPSTSAGTAEGCSATAAYGSHMKTSSPAVAQPAPGQEPHYPEASGPKLHFTTEMANAAAEDYQREKFSSIFEWYERYQKRKAEEHEAEQKEKEKEDREQRVLKRKLEEEEVSPPEAKRAAVDPTTLAALEPQPSEVVVLDEEKPVYETIGEIPAKMEENPLKKMQMMADFPAFQPPSRISDVAGENVAKRDKAEKSENDGKEGNLTPQPQMPHPFGPPGGMPPMAAGQPLPSPYPPYGHPGMHLGMMPPFPGMPQMHPGYRPPMAFPSGKPGAFPPMPPMPHPGMRLPPNLHPMQVAQWQMHQRIMAAQGMSPSQMPGGMSPFPGMPPRFPQHPMMTAGPLSGPTPMMNKMMPGGPMTAPVAPPMPSPYAPMCSPYQNGMPSQGSPMMHRPDSTMAPNPMFGFSDSAAPVHPSMHPQTLQDMTNKAPF